MAALDWIDRKPIDITDLNTPSVVRTALDALKLKQDGTAAAENTVNRKRTVFSNCLRYAVERELLTTLPSTRSTGPRPRPTTRSTSGSSPAPSWQRS